MNARYVSALQKVSEALLLLLAFALPVALHFRLFDAAFIKVVTIQAAGMGLLALWALRFWETGRIEIPVPRAPLATGALALVVWTGLSSAFQSHHEAVLLDFLEQGIGLLVFLLTLTEAASYSFAAALSDWILAAAAAVAMSALAKQSLPAPIPVLRPLGAFYGMAFPIALARSLDEESGLGRRAAAAALALLCPLAVLASESAPGLSALLSSAAAFATLSLAVGRTNAHRRIGLVAAAMVPLSFWTAFHLREEPLTQELFRIWTLPKNLSFEGIAWAAFLGASLMLPLQDIARRMREGETREGLLMAGMWAAVLGLLAQGNFLHDPVNGPILMLLAGCLSGMALERGAAQVLVLPIGAPIALRRALAVATASGLVWALAWPVCLFRSETEFNIGVFYRRHRNYGEAAAHLDQVSNWHANRAPWARMLAGDIYLENSQTLPLALKRYQQAQALKPDSPAAAYKIGFALAKQGLWKDAVENYRQALRLDPGFTSVYAELADTCAILGRKDEALAAAHGWVRAAPQDPAAWRFLADQYRERKQFRVARRLLEKAGRVSDVARAGRSEPVY